MRTQNVMSRLRYRNLMAQVRGSRQTTHLLGIDEYHRLCEAAERSEDEWLNRLADQAESEGTEGAVPMEQMAALLRSTN